MTGREQIEAALSSDGTREIPVVICYEGIYIRDHWQQLTSCPWWYQHAPDIARQVRWREEVMANIGQDWFDLPAFPSRADRACLSLDVRSDGVFQVNRCTGRSVRLTQEPVGGSHIAIQPVRRAELDAATPETIDALIPLAPEGNDTRHTTPDSGHDDLAAALLHGAGAARFPIRWVNTPLGSCVTELWGFEQTMLYVARRPELVDYACRRFLANSLIAVQAAARAGAAGMFIEDIFTDIISPDAFSRLALPYARQLVEEIRRLGMKSVHYFCGDPMGKWDLLFAIGADALSLEESKKGFAIDIEDVVARANGRCAVLGNLDAVGVLQRGSEAQLRAEIARQLAAGRRNGNQFIMSLGSPVTPETSVERVRLYCDLAHELGRQGVT